MNNFENKIARIVNIVSFIQMNFGIIGSIASLFYKAGILIFCLCMLISLLSVVIYIITNMYLREANYISFIEFLFNNKTHSFTLLPKISLHMHQTKKKNKFHVHELFVHYEIDAKPYKDSENPFLGDMTATFNYTIYNDRNFPKYFHLCMGNDYTSDPPDIQIKYGSQHDYISHEADELPRDKYIITRVRNWQIKLEESNINGSKTFNLSIKIKYKKSFNFDLTAPDIIIFLPKAHGEKIDEVKYVIDLKNFPSYDFRFSCHDIVKRNGKYEIGDLSAGNIIADKNMTSYNINFTPLNRSFFPIWEERYIAYYFEIWEGKKKVIHH